MLLKDVIGKDLPGWQSLYCYVMELSHSLMGCFPAMKSGAKKIVVCLNRDDLEKIWSKLPKREVKVNKFLFHVNKGENRAILINSPQGDESDSGDFFLIQGNELGFYLQEDDFFEWAPGLWSFKDESKAVFPKE